VRRAPLPAFDDTARVVAFEQSATGRTARAHRRAERWPGGAGDAARCPHAAEPARRIDRNRRAASRLVATCALIGALRRAAGTGADSRRLVRPAGLAARAHELASELATAPEKVRPGDLAAR
jgi:hypothetical protein